MKQLTAILFLLIALLPRTAEGQCYSSQKKPSWADGYFDQLTNSYIEMATATGRSEAEARNKAAQVVMVNRGFATGQQVNVRVQNGNVVVTGGSNVEVKSRVIDEYREQCGRGEYRVSLLVQTAVNPSFRMEGVRVTDQYPFSARVFVPGMAQLHKGSTLKGVLFIVGEAALVGGVVGFEGMRTSAESKISTERDPFWREAYIDDVSMYQDRRNRLIGMAVALYAWNIIDGVTAKGKKHVQVLGKADINISPFVTADMGRMGSGISLTLNF